MCLGALFGLQKRFEGDIESSGLGHEMMFQIMELSLSYATSLQAGMRTERFNDGGR